MATSKKLKVKEPEAIPAEETKENKMFQTDGQLTVDVYETDSNFVVVSAIAGISIKDIDIVVDKDMLIIKGCRSNPNKENNRNYFYQECYWGPFSRKIILPENIDSSSPEAEFEKGLLAIKFQKNIAKNKKDISIKES